MRIVGLADRHGAAHLISALLHHVGEFVSDQLASRGTSWLIGPLAEENILAGGESARVEGAVQIVGLRVGVDPDPAEIGAERTFHLVLYTAIEVLAATAFLLNGAFDGMGNVVPAHTLSGRRPVSFHILVAVLPLQLQEGTARSIGLRSGRSI